MSRDVTPVLAVGLRHSERFTVAPRHTVPQVDPDWPGFKDMPAALATAMMLAFVEQTCIMALRPFLLPDQRTVGTHLDVSHVAPTPIGMNVTADVELVGIEGKALHFKVWCRDGAGLIGEGTHQRALIDVNRFTRRLQEKLTHAGASLTLPIT
jgi:fluoroacetyl-CoA thioesterase